MKIGVLIPTRGDRPEFLANALRMLRNQTLRPTDYQIVDDAPRNEAIDISWRYQLGYKRLSGQGLDMIVLWEDDDWYAPNYLETLALEWQKHPNIILLGQFHTIYYSLRIRKWFKFHHDQRSSAMNTAIKPDLENIDWGLDHDPYTDLHLWFKLGGSEWANNTNKILFTPTEHICIGMKHGIGKVGGEYHSKDFDRYEHDDNGFLEQVIKPVDPVGFDFYQTIKI